MKNFKQHYEESIAQFREGCTIDNLACESKKLALEQECKSSNTCMAIYEMNKDRYSFLHWIFESEHHTEPITFSMNSLEELIHPLDIEYVVESKMEAISRMNAIPYHELTHYKLIYECRMKDQHGIYHRVVHQFMVLETNSEGKPCLLRLQLDAMPGKADTIPPRGLIIINVHTRKKLVSNAQTRLTDTEIATLKWIVKGYDSNEIAEKQYRSIHTVNNHRRNILRKTQMQDIGQSILYAHVIGVL